MPTRVRLVQSWDEAQDFVSWLNKPRRLLGVDTETTGLSLARDRVRLIQFGDRDEGYAMGIDEWGGLARHVLENYEGKLVLQNAPFDAGMLQVAGYPFPWNRVHDTRPMLHLHDSLGPQALKPAAGLHLGAWAKGSEATLKKAMTKNKWTWETVPLDFPPYWAYGVMDTIITVRLAEKLWPLIQYAREAYDLEMATERVASNMQIHGVRLDVEYVEQAAAILRKQVAERLESLPVNPNSPSQIVQALLDDGVTLSKRTEGGAFSVDEAVLSALDHPLAKALLAYRKDKKVLANYFEPMLYHQTDGWLHPSINTLQALTSRMSITDPALQTLPRTAYVRDAIIPDNEDEVLVLVDYDTQELRVAAHLAQERNMIQAFLEDRDLHAETAKLAYGPDFTKEHRQYAKNGMYSYAYGAKPRKFAETVMPARAEELQAESASAAAAARRAKYAEAERIFAGIAEAYPGLPRAMQQLIGAVKERADGGDKGWIKLIDGRRLSVPVNRAYAGFNWLIQGSCATVLKRALVNLDSAGLGPYLRLPVHDETVFSMPRDMVKDALPTIKDCMERHDLSVPLTVSATVVDRWGDPYRERSR